MKTLQNTRYSIDEKLEQSFINLFSRKPASASNGNGDLLAGQHQSGNSLGHNVALDQEDDEAMRDKVVAESGSDYSDGANDYAMDDDNEDYQQIDTSIHDLKEEVEFHNGRLRRKVVSPKFEDNDDQVVY